MWGGRDYMLHIQTWGENYASHPISYFSKHVLKVLRQIQRRHDQLANLAAAYHAGSRNKNSMKNFAAFRAQNFIDVPYNDILVLVRASKNGFVYVLTKKVCK